MRGALVDLSSEGERRLMTMDALKNQKKKMSTNTFACLLFIGYLMLGVAFYCFSPLNYTVIDAIYFSVISFATVGYGDTHITHAVRPFTTFYVLLGAGVVGSLFGIFSNDVMEFQEEAMKRKLVQTAQNMNRVINKTTSTLRKYQQNTISHYLKSEEIDGSTATFRQRISRMFVERLNKDSAGQIKDMNLAIYEDKLREVRSKGLVDGLFVVFSMFAGAICMVFIEKWTFNEAIYWAVVTMTTVGFGDVTPQTYPGKMFTIAYTLVGCSLAAKGFRDIVTYPMIAKAQERELFITQQFGDELSESTLSGILRNDFFARIPNLRQDAGQIRKSEFVLLLLRLMGKVEDKDILLASKIFDRLDGECDGVLSEEDQREEMRKARERDRAKALEQQRRAQEQAELLAQQQASGMAPIGMEAVRSLIASATSMMNNATSATAASPTHHGGTGGYSNIGSTHGNDGNGNGNGNGGGGGGSGKNRNNSMGNNSSSIGNRVRGLSSSSAARLFGFGSRSHRSHSGSSAYSNRSDADGSLVELAENPLHHAQGGQEAVVVVAGNDGSLGSRSDAHRSGGLPLSPGPTMRGKDTINPLQHQQQQQSPAPSATSGGLSPSRPGSNRFGGASRQSAPLFSVLSRSGSLSLSSHSSAHNYDEENEEEEMSEEEVEMAVSSILRDIVAEERSATRAVDNLADRIAPAGSGTNSGSGSDEEQGGLGGAYVRVGAPSGQQEQQQDQRGADASAIANSAIDVNSGDAEKDNDGDSGDSSSRGDDMV